MNAGKLYECLAEAVEKPLEDVKKFPSTEKLSGIGMDSIRFIKFIILIEESFNFIMDDSDLLMSNFETMQKIQETFSKYEVLLYE